MRRAARSAPSSSTWSIWCASTSSALVVASGSSCASASSSTCVDLRPSGAPRRRRREWPRRARRPSAPSDPPTFPGLLSRWSAAFEPQDGGSHRNLPTFESKNTVGRGMLRGVRALRRRFEDSARSFGQVFANPNIRRIEGAWAASIIAHWAYGIALAVYAYRDGGAAAVGLVGLVRFLPSAVASPFASVLGDRYRRERVIVVAELVRAVLLAATTAVVVLEGSAGCRLRPCRPGRHRVLGRSSGAGGPAPDRGEDAAGADGRQRHLEHDREPRDLRRPRDRRRAPGRDQRAGGLRGHRRGFPARGATGQPRPGRDAARAPRAARRRLARVHGRLRHDLPRARASRPGDAARRADVRRRRAQRPDRRHRAPAARPG